MGQIEKYITDSLVTENDILLGSDGDNFNQTKNFRISDLLSLLTTNQSNNKLKQVSTFVDVNNTIESGLQNIDLVVTGEDSPVIISILKEQLQEGTSANTIVKYNYFFPLGNGVYQPVSDSVSLDDLFLLDISNPDVNDVSTLDNSVVINLGDISGSDLVSTVNSAIPSFDLSNSNNEYFFSFEKDSLEFLAKFVGNNGLYGSNDLQSTSVDFIIFNDTDVDSDNVRAIYKEVSLANSYASESLELNAVASQINSLSVPFEVSDKELFIAYSDSLRNDVGNSYRSVYIINTGKGVYGDGEKQIVSSAILKVRGDRINENLSSYNNDQGFLTSVSGVDQKVDKAGDVMSGDLDFDGNKVIGLGSPTNSGDAASKGYVDGLVSFRGKFSSISSIKSLAGSQNGDYAIFSSGDKKQIWVYDGSWNIYSFKHLVLDINSSFTVDDSFYGLTLNIVSSGVVITFPSNVLQDGFDLNIRNFSGSDLSLIGAGASTVTKSSIPTGNLANVSEQSNVFIVDSTDVKENDEVNFGIYDYEDTQTSISLSSGVFSNLSNNGNGSNTYKNTVPDVGEIYNIATDRFDFSNLNVNDQVEVRIDITFSSVTAGQSLDCEMVLGEGQAGEYTIPFFTAKYFDTSTSSRIVRSLPLYIGNNLTKDNPALIRVKSSGNGSVNVNGFFVKVIKKNL